MIKKDKLIVVTVFLTVLEFVIAFFSPLKDIFEKLINDFQISSLALKFVSHAFPAGIVYFINYFVISPYVYKFLRLVWRFIGHYKYMDRMMTPIIRQAVEWLISCECHWGVRHDANQCQNANTCEALIALNKSSLAKKKKNAYKKAFRNVLANLTEDGLPSKSLKEATVVCTSMILYLLSLDCKSGLNTCSDYSVYEKQADNLWKNRGECGWGVYLFPVGQETTSLANTNWALRCLNQYNISSTEEFKEYLRAVYEHNNEGTFGFIIGDSPRLVTTAMYLSLYFELSDDLRKEIDNVYDVKKAVDYVYKHFVSENMQLEIEQLYGINKEGEGPLKAPWNHVVIGYCMDALSKAYTNRLLKIIQMDRFLRKIKGIIKNNIQYHNNQCYYLPDNMQQGSTGVFTYPTTYMIWGMSSLKAAIGGRS